MESSEHNWTSLLAALKLRKSNVTLSTSWQGNELGAGNISTLFFILYGIISVFTVAGNTLNCVIILNSTVLRNRANMFMVNLCVANIIYICVSSPVYLNRYAVTPVWRYGEFLCKISSSVIYVTATASFYFMVMTAFDRKKTILSRQCACGKNADKREDTRGKYYYAAVWMLSLGVAIPFMVFRKVELNSFFLDKPQLRCRYSFPDPQQLWHKYMELSGVVVIYLIPVCVIVFCYARIFIFLCRQPASVGNRRRRSRNRRALVTLVLIVVIFVIGWTPLFGTYALAQLGVVKRLNNKFVFLGLHVAGLLPGCFTPFVYLTLPTYREELTLLIRKVTHPGRGADETDANRGLTSSSGSKRHEARLESSENSVSASSIRTLKNVSTEMLSIQKSKQPLL